MIKKKSESHNSIEGSELLIGNGLPDYERITPEKISTQIPLLLLRLKEDLFYIESLFKDKLDSNKELSWSEVIDPIHRITESLRWSWSIVSHLNGVCNTKELRDVHSKLQPKIIEFTNKLGQSRIIYKALEKLKINSSEKLNETQTRILDNELLSMKHQGVGLNGSSKQDFSERSQKIAQLSTTFSNNLLDSTKQWSLLLTKQSEVEGLPTRVLENLASAAEAAGDLTDKGKKPTKEKGPWRVGLDMPTYLPFMTYSKNRVARESLYKANIKRASYGDKNNQPLIEEILSLRKKQAKSLGYKNWAEMSLTSKMARKVSSAEKLLEEIRAAAFPIAKKELSELQAFASKNNSSEPTEIKPWDLNYWSEQLRQERYNLNQEVLRAWFPLPSVLEGLFKLCNRLFGISIIPGSKETPKWHPDVQFYKILNEENDEIAFFYLDPYSRPSSKRGGAWMDECLIRQKSINGKQTLPVAYLICNQTPPSGDKPSLMSFEEVQTLFHEFGHGLQHMLTTVDYPQAAGINNIEWDAVELPSQFMENWCLDRETLIGLARHWETKESLPEEEFKKLQKSRNFNSGLSNLRQIHFALTDLKLHSYWDDELGISPDEVRRNVAKNTTVIPPIKEDNFLCSFGHIFAGGYSAGYYSYKWAEVLSADAFSAFEEIGLEQEDKIKEKGRLFKNTILSLGGSKDPTEIFKLFRGRKPSTVSLIKHSGLN